MRMRDLGLTDCIEQKHLAPDDAGITSHATFTPYQYEKMDKYYRLAVYKNHPNMIPQHILDKVEANRYKALVQSQIVVRPITNVVEFIPDSLPDEPIKRRYSGAQIFRALACKHGVSEAELKSTKRTTEIMKIRMIILDAILTNCHHLSWPQIGHIVGRDHSTLMHMNKQINKLKTDGKWFV